jgi:hypothetical protein
MRQVGRPCPRCFATQLGDINCRTQSREFTLPRYQSSGVSPAAPPHSIGINRG